MFLRMREKRRQREKAEQIKRLATEAESLERQAVNLASLVDALSEPQSLWDETAADCPIVTKRGEEVIGVFEGVSLVEMRSRKLAYKGTSYGLSIRVAKGVYYRPSMHSGAISQTVDEWKALDEDGTLVISNQRAVYTGMRFSREFPFAKLLSWGADLDRSSFSSPAYLVSLPVSSRVRTSAVAFPAGGNADVRDRLLSVLQCGISLFGGTHDDFIRRLRSDVEDLRSRSEALSREAAEAALGQTYPV
ncbi:MAG: hypothetical protein OXD34_05730 [bacterium]|nr:hypothetical protein [bacterium]